MGTAVRLAAGWCGLALAGLAAGLVTGSAAGGLAVVAAATLGGCTARQWQGRRAADRLRLLESAVIHARDAVVILDAEPEKGLGRPVRYVNEAFTTLTGYAAAEVVGRSLHMLRGPATCPVALARIRDALAAGQPLQTELLNYRKDGSELWVELSLVPVRASAGGLAHWVMIQRDIGDRKRLEDQLRQAQKMETVGRLAGGIAHDFNNLLTGVIGHLDLVRLPAGDPNAALVATADRAAQRAADLTRKLLGVARKNQLLVGPVRVADLVGEVVELVRRTSDPRVHFTAEVPPAADLPALTADAALLNQALMNLVLNARDAMPGGGRLTVTAAGVSLTSATAQARPGGRAGLFLRLTVADTGHGMPAAVRARLFEPFFTTKPVGQGTGLGLAMVHGIVEQHGGWIECATAPGTGTRFEVYLPAAAAGVEATPPPRPWAASDLAARAGGATVLLVDDEELIRALGRSVLEGAGYRVVEAADGRAGVEAFRRESAAGGVDLVVLDYMMPEASGREAFDAILAADPAARVLFSSGYSADDLADITGPAGLLAKPYRPADLLAAVRAVLAGEPVPAGVEPLQLSPVA